MFFTKLTKILFLFLLSVLCFQTNAQQKYWVVFKDKGTETASVNNISNQTLEKRKILNLDTEQYTDIPVNNDYKEAINSLGIYTLHTSKWLNAVSAYLSLNQIKELNQLAFVEEIVPIATYFYPLQITYTEEELHLALQQIQGDAIINDSLTGKNIKVGVIDGGYYKAKTTSSLKHIFDNKQIKEIRDFIYPNKTNHFSSPDSGMDDHGTMVLRMITGYMEKYGIRYGLAKDAQFYLARTEHGGYEARTEEDDWVAAIEWMDELGVRVINSSLGYGKNFTDPSENYTPKQMNGKTALITKAAQIACEQKGLILVISAGNEGAEHTWRVISAPADAKDVIAVGATQAKWRQKIGYSSIGPDFLDYVKPNISCYSPNGTSFSAPVITGLVACMLEKKPDLTNKQVKEILEKSSHLYPYSNNYLGYGVPQAKVILGILENPDFHPHTSKKRIAGTEKFELKDIKQEKVCVFHKTDHKTVMKQTFGKIKKGKLIIKRPKNVLFTTLDLGDEVIEIVWQ